MKYTILKNGLFIILFVFVNTLFAQVGINTTTPHVSSALDISSVTSGVLVPRMTEVQKNAINIPAKGLLVFQIDAEEGFWYFDGVIWRPIGSATGTVANGEFISENNIVHNTTSINNDDFVFGSTSLNDISGSGDDKRFFFDKGKAAFRSGSNNGTSWDNAQIGTNSFAAGTNNTASGFSSVALGRLTVATGSYAVSIGRSNTVTSLSGTSFGFSNQVTADYGTALGRANTVSGQYAIAGGTGLTSSGFGSVALGTTNTASGDNSFAMGRLNSAAGLNSAAIGFRNTAESEGAFALGKESIASGENSIAIGNNVQVPSYSEIAIGLYNTEYIPASITGFDGRDRIFSVGNGSRVSGVTIRRNAMTVLKNGNTGIGVEEPTEKLEVNGKIKASSINFSGLPTFADEVTATLGNLETGDLYQTPAGEIRIKM